jgi:hypothetical protein
VKPSIQKRLQALEERTDLRNANATADEQSRAWSRLYAALHSALPTIYPTEVRQGTREFVERTVNFEVQILALDERIMTGTVTAADSNVLAHLCDLDLKIAGTTMEHLVAPMAWVYRKY